MRAFIEFLLRRRILVLALAGILAAGGMIAWTRLPIDAFPDVTNVQVMILAEAPGFSAVDVEQQVTYPIQQMGGPEVTQAVLSKAGFSQVVVVFQTMSTSTSPGSRFRAACAKGTSQEHRSELAPSAGRARSSVHLEGGAFPMELRTIQDYIVAPQLKPIAGVNEVNSFGGFVRQYHVLVRPDALLRYDLSLRQVVEALERNNANAAGGFIVRGWEQTYVRGLGQLSGAGDIGDVVLKAQGGVPVHVHDVADVVVGPQPRQGAVTRDGKGRVVAGMVIMLRGENSRDVVTRVKEAIPSIRKSLPKGARLNVFYDRTSLIEACIRTVVNGGIFVVIVLFLFLAEMRTALIVVASLPLTFLATFLVMGWAGLSSNLMSLGGLAFSVGMVVDASIVIVENVRRHFAERHEGKFRMQVTVRAVEEVARPVAFSVLIIGVVLVPLFSLQGIEGKMFAPLALTMIFAMLTSLVVALTIVPVLSDMILPREKEKEFGFVRRFHQGYLAVLSAARRKRAITLVSLFALRGRRWRPGSAPSSCRRWTKAPSPSTSSVCRTPPSKGR
jgi:cobalt-zinc-cadmium resistance protein CzcA